MYAPALYLALATILNLASTATIPFARDLHPASNSTLSARSGTERVFLAYCYYGYPGSEMLYYKTDAESRTGQQPEDIAFLTPQAFLLTPYEGVTLSGTFESGDVFTSQIVAGAQNLADFAFAGTGYNDYGKFNCYKDNGRQLFSALWGSYTQVCRSRYYCEDA